MNSPKKGRFLTKSGNSRKGRSRHCSCHDDLSFFEENGCQDFLSEIVVRAGRNAINENKAMGLPVTYMEDGWVVQRMPEGNIERIAEITTLKEVSRNRKLTKGTILHVRNGNQSPGSRN